MRTIFLCCLMTWAAAADLQTELGVEWGFDNSENAEQWRHWRKNHPDQLFKRAYGDPDGAYWSACFLVDPPAGAQPEFALAIIILTRSIAEQEALDTEDAVAEQVRGRFKRLLCAHALGLVSIAVADGDWLSRNRDRLAGRIPATDAADRQVLAVYTDILK